MMQVLTRLYRWLRWILGSVFVWSGVVKLMDPPTFAVLIDAYGLLPDVLVLPVAVMLPILEVLAGAGLMVDLRGSLAVISGLLILFVVILGYGIRMGLDVDCGCFGPEDPEAEAFHNLRPALYRDLTMLAAAAFLYVWRRLRRIEPLNTGQLVDKYTKRKTEDAYV
ncbi:MAG TPA: MauE/DoxX family redox-associated membrane protein [Desulfosarcina sp.]|nr:MauE/DoxX family redox-associated membrane protein [Desulfosarcina sp.]